MPDYFELLTESDIDAQTAERNRRVRVGMDLIDLQRNNPDLVDVSEEDLSLLREAQLLHGADISGIISEAFAEQIQIRGLGVTQPPESS